MAQESMVSVNDGWQRIFHHETAEMVYLTAFASQNTANRPNQ
jgi:hypothetical protein